MTSLENCMFAQKYSARLLIKLGAGLIVMALVSSTLSLPDNTSLIIAMIGVLISCGLIYYLTEQKLKNLQ